MIWLPHVSVTLKGNKGWLFIIPLKSEPNDYLNKSVSKSGD